MSHNKSRGVLITRAFKFIRILTNGDWHTTPEVAGKLHVSRKTVYRWLDGMEDAGYIVETANDTGARTVYRLSRREHGIQRTGAEFPRGSSQASGGGERDSNEDVSILAPASDVRDSGQPGLFSSELPGTGEAEQGQAR